MTFEDFKNIEKKIYKLKVTYHFYSGMIGAINNAINYHSSNKVVKEALEESLIPLKEKRDKADKEALPKVLILQEEIVNKFYNYLKEKYKLSKEQMEDFIDNIIHSNPTDESIKVFLKRMEVNESYFFGCKEDTYNTIINAFEQKFLKGN